MSSLAVRVEGIGKQYQLGLREKRHQTFREALVDLAAAPMRRLKHLSGRSHEDDTFWALKDISFDVPEGEVLGIIGHNGAGKSTLLKILSRITEPTEGRATIHGRVASLLEVGTGFHNELTGRENVYLNGAILGMSRREIDRKFDEIVDFAGVEKFLDTPIKRYSSGMKVRLAFAVAAHLDPEILIIDEVLAVGDQEFQNKCLGKMRDVSSDGRTVLFVSHNMAAVMELCSRAFRLVNGGIADTGSSVEVVERYQKNLVDAGADESESLNHSSMSLQSEVFRLKGIHIASPSVDEMGTYAGDRELCFTFNCQSTISPHELLFSFALLNESGQECLWERVEGSDIDAVAEAGDFSVRIRVPPMRFRTGMYSVNFMTRITGSLEKLCHLKEAAHFRIQTDAPQRSKGIVTPPLEWSIEE